jgi:hypothetical protein
MAKLDIPGLPKKNGDDKTPKSRPRGPKALRRVSLGAFLVLLIFGLIVLGVWIGRTTPSTPAQQVIGYAAATFLFGFLVGLSEILSRYRDEPLLAAGTAFGVAYLVLNGIISVAAFAVMRRYADQIFPTIKNDLFLTSVIAGFGAMAVFRSKFFTFRSTDGKDYPIGPSIVLDTVLKTIDSKIDRRRATERQDEVFHSITGLTFTPLADFVEASLPSFQNLSPDDRSGMVEVIKQYREQTRWSDPLKCLALGFAFLTIAGDENYEQVIDNLKQYIATQNVTPPVPPAIPGGGGAPPAAPGAAIPPAIGQ